MIFVRPKPFKMTSNFRTKRADFDATDTRCTIFTQIDHVTNPLFDLNYEHTASPEQ